MTAISDAINRLQNLYNDGVYDAVDNPGGFDGGGHRIQFLNAIRDVATVGANLQPLFVFEGDSLSNIGHLGTWPTKLAVQNPFFNLGTSLNFALDGDQAASMVGEYASQAGAVASLEPGMEAYFFLWAGANDIGASASAATIYGNLSTIWAAARASGYKVVAFTLHAVGVYSPTQNGVNTALNALILSNPGLYDYVVRLDALLTNSADASLYNADTIHLNDAGNALVAQEVIATLLDVPPVYATPADTFAGGLQLNGRMDISQQFGSTAKTGLTGTGQTYIVDGVKVNTNGSMVLTAQQVADASPGLSNSLKLSVTTAQASLGAGDFSLFLIPLEGYRTACLAFGTNSAQPVSLGFWVKAHRIGSYSGAIVNATINRSYPFSFTQNVADKWEFKTVTIPGDITGAWNKTNGIGLLLTICVASGSTYTAAANAWASGFYIGTNGTTNGVAATSDTFQITGVIILPGIRLPSSQRLPLILRPRDQEIMLCARHLWVIVGDPVVGTGQVFSTTSAVIILPLPAPLRAAPTITLSAAADWSLSDASLTAKTVTSLLAGAGVAEQNTAQLYFTVASGLVAGNATSLFRTVAGTGNIIVDSRL